MSNSVGLFEHAKLDAPRTEHGFCVDDVSRALVLLCGEMELDSESEKLLELYLEFILQSIAPDGSCHNRRNVLGVWTDKPSTEDCWGRAVWALGHCSVYAPDENQRLRAFEGFKRLANASTSNLMALTFASLGAGEMLIAHPHEKSAEKILRLTRERILPIVSTDEWFWPEPRLRYSNGSIPHAALLIGSVLDDEATLEIGFRMLDFLLSTETLDEHFSVTPVGGRGPRDHRPSFDQQPIEIAALANVCAQAWTITGEKKWLLEVDRAWDWFLGSNDVGALMFNPVTGAGYDGLQSHGPNLNQGAESTIAMLFTAQLALRSVAKL